MTPLAALAVVLVPAALIAWVGGEGALALVLLFAAVICALAGRR